MPTNQSAGKPVRNLVLSAKFRNGGLAPSWKLPIFLNFAGWFLAFNVRKERRDRPDVSRLHNSQLLDIDWSITLTNLGRIFLRASSSQLFRLATWTFRVSIFHYRVPTFHFSSRNCLDHGTGATQLIIRRSHRLPFT